MIHERLQTEVPRQENRRDGGEDLVVSLLVGRSLHPGIQQIGTKDDCDRSRAENRSGNWRKASTKSKIGRNASAASPELAAEYLERYKFTNSKSLTFAEYALGHVTRIVGRVMTVDVTGETAWLPGDTVEGRRRAEVDQ